MSRVVVAVDVVRIDHGGPRLELPRYMTPGAAGLDLHAAGPADVVLAPGERRLVPTGIAVAVPVGFEAQVRPRSGLAHRHGVTILNAPGTIDSDYRGEVQVLLVNLGSEAAVLRAGERIAQLVFAPVAHVAWREVTELAVTDRGSGGFGSTDGGRAG